MPWYFLRYTKKGHMHIKTSGPGGSHIGFNSRPTILMGPADPKVGAGGGTGGGTGVGTGGGGGDDPPPLNEAQTAAVGKIVNDAVNGAITSHLTRFKKQFGEEIGKTLSDSLSPIGEQLKTLAERGIQQGGQGGGGQGGGSGGGGSDQFAAQIKQLEAKYEGQLRELRTANDQEKAERAKEREIRLRDEERGILTDTLRTSGLPDTMIKAAVALLHSEEKRIGRTEDNRVVFRTEKGTGAARYVDEQDVAAGVADWLKTDDGKAFVPARPAQGAGGQPSRPGARPGSPAEAKAQAAADLAKVLMGGGMG